MLQTLFFNKMSRITTNSVFSKIFLLFTGIVYFIGYIYSSVLPDILSLSPQDVIKNLSLWKLVSFPFASGGLESIMLFAFVFYFISSKLEQYIEGLKYPLWLFLMTLLQGCILTLVFINSDVVISGMDGISFYVLVVYSLLKSKDKIIAFNFPPIPIFAFALLLGFVWFGLKLVNFSTTGDDSMFLSALGSSLFGITSGLVHYLQIRITGINANSRNLRNGDDLRIPPPEELSVAHTLNSNRLRKYYQSNQPDLSEADYYLLSDDMSENEDRLNEILEKISSSGQSSLSDFERRFLNEYSKRI